MSLAAGCCCRSQEEGGGSWDKEEKNEQAGEAVAMELQSLVQLRYCPSKRAPVTRPQPFIGCRCRDGSGPQPDRARLPSRFSSSRLPVRHPPCPLQACSLLHQPPTILYSLRTS